MTYVMDDYGDAVINERYITHLGTPTTITRYLALAEPYIRLSMYVRNTGGTGTMTAQLSW